MSGLYAQLILLALWPALVVGLVVWAQRGQLARPRLFLLVSIAGSYALYIAVIVGLDEPVGYVPDASGSVQTTDGRTISYFLEPFVPRLGIYTLLAAPSVWVFARSLSRKVD